jgi:SAM-dependent methyltransferase
MDHATQRLLGEINRRFYEVRAADFSATRDHPWPGWERLLEHLPSRGKNGGGGGLHILDVGCGNGRFGRFLLDREVAIERYVGIDFSDLLLDHARESLKELSGSARQLMSADLLAAEPDAALPFGRFDLVVAFGLLHHVPAHSARNALIRAMSRRVAVGGLMACTFWRFQHKSRFESRLLQWNDYNLVASAPVDLSQLDAGDHLLSFGESAATPRYCHHCDNEEIDQLVEASQLDCVLRFDADGRSGDLNHHALMQRKT